MSTATRTLSIGAALVTGSVALAWLLQRKAASFACSFWREYEEFRDARDDVFAGPDGPAVKRAFQASR